MDRLGIAVLRIALVQALEAAELLLLGEVADGAQQRADRLVAHRRDADPLTRLHELENHVCAREGLAGAGWPLDRQHAAVELEAEPLRVENLGIDVFVARPDLRRDPLLASAARRAERDDLGAATRAARGHRCGASAVRAPQSRRAVHEPRRTFEQQVARRTVLAGRVDAVRRNPAADLE